MSSSYNFKEISCLIIDDSSYFRDLLKIILKGFGIQQTSESNNIREANWQLEEVSYDIIFCNWNLDNESGLDFVRSLRKPQNKYATIPLVMVSAHSEIHNVMQARDTGVNAFLTKPITPTSLAKILVSLIEYPRQFIRTKTYFGPDRRVKEIPNSCFDRRTPIKDK
jgi:two-component system, chemotaxis family, chemotaxis protein CheY